jgi:hypothetical protein
MSERIIDTTFQTVDRNTERTAEIELAKSIVRTAESVLVRALAEAFPVGAHVRKIVAAGPRYSYFTVEKHTDYPSKWMHLKNRNTGVVTVMDMSSSSFDLVTYAYVVEDIDRGLETGSTVAHSADLELAYRELHRKKMEAAA